MPVKFLVKLLLVLAIMPFTSLADTNVNGDSNIVEHGGGCRKSSPPGQCCHMDNSTGTVHCH